MAKPLPVPAQSSTHAFGVDLHQFLELYEAAYPAEVVHIEEPLQADWEIPSLGIKFKKAERVPILVCDSVIVDVPRAEFPLVTFLMASRLRLARTFGAEVRSAGVACYERVQERVKPIVVSGEQALV